MQRLNQWSEFIRTQPNIGEGGGGGGGGSTQHKQGGLGQKKLDGSVLTGEHECLDLRCS